MTDRISISVQGHEFMLELANNSSARALTEMVGDGDLRVAMQDYGGFEKVGTLPQRLPTNDEQITTRPGDVILYQGDKLSLYYAANTWNLTRIGHIADVDEPTLRAALGDGDVTLRLTLPR